jgi:hypothetical protein
LLRRNSALDVRYSCTNEAQPPAPAARRHTSVKSGRLVSSLLNTTSNL